jgi:hypothetical protein
VAGGAELQADKVVELVASVGGGGQAEPTAGRDLADGVLEGRSGNVVAFIDHDQPVSVGESGKVVASRQCLQGRDVQDTGGLGTPAAALAGPHAEQIVDANAPLVGEGLAVHEHESRHAVGSDDGAGDDGLAGAGRCDQHGEVVAEHGIARCLLLGLQLPGELEGAGLAVASLVGDL